MVIAADAVAGKANTAVKTRVSICGRGIGLGWFLRDCKMFLLTAIVAATAATTIWPNAWSPEDPVPDYAI